MSTTSFTSNQANGHIKLFVLGEPRRKKNGRFGSLVRWWGADVVLSHTEFRVLVVMSKCSWLNPDMVFTFEEVASSLHRSSHTAESRVKQTENKLRSATKHRLLRALGDRSRQFRAKRDEIWFRTPSLLVYRDEYVRNAMKEIVSAGYVFTPLPNIT